MNNGTDRKKMIQKGFDTVAEGYDHPSLSFFPETATRLVEHLNLNPTDKLLDVCTGTGCVAVRAAEKLIDGHVTGIDLSSGMFSRRKVTVFTLFIINYSLFTAFSWWDVVWNAGWRSLLNQLSEEEQQQFKENHLNEIDEVVGNDGTWFNTEVLIAVGG